MPFYIVKSGETTMNRRTEIERCTSETDIAIELCIDGDGEYDIDTGIGFFNHMLEGFAKHGFFDLLVRAHGDTEVDTHHTVGQGRHQEVWLLYPADGRCARACEP